jgi:hypothetical protein
MWSSQRYWRDWLAAKSDVGRNCPVLGLHCIAEDLDTRIFALIVLVEAGRKEDECVHIRIRLGSVCGSISRPVIP